jgi:sortase A
VRETTVVGPSDVWILDATEQPTLTLITCYPFRYVGKAPRRFIVRAERTTTTEATTPGFSEQDEVHQP